MTIPLKSAAKKAYKDIKENKKEIAGLSYAQFLSRFASWCGFKNYHDYQKQTEVNNNKDRVTSLKIKLAHKLAHSKNLMYAKAGMGKTLLMQELIIHMMSMGKKVRILDTGRSYLNFARTLQGDDVTSEQNWFSDAALALYDTDISNFNPQFFSDKDIYYVVDEYHYTSKVLNLVDLFKTTSYTLIAQTGLDFISIGDALSHTVLCVEQVQEVPSKYIWTYTVKEKDDFFQSILTKKIYLDIFFK